MTGTIKQIDNLVGRQGPYIALRISCEDGIHRTTYLQATNRNWKHWSHLLGKGKVLEGLVAKGDKLIDADCTPSVFHSNQLEMQL
jgi:hypothetical protein